MIGLTSRGLDVGMSLKGRAACPLVGSSVGRSMGFVGRPERQWPKPVVLFVLMSAICAISVGCGVIGAPIAPEDVGIAPRLEKEQEQEAKGREQAAQRQEAGSGAVEPPSEPELPPLRPVGTR
ncbi:MAG: hypothetical protein KatS3mg082_2235 [Nitrospiraceae bacterium]|nr:MAG: hypothetical protein KatS3mg082_2235 [Nitrospiraceae bacterium]